MSTENQPAETPVPDLPAEAPFQSEKVRRTIIASTWIVILLVLPIWWATASLQRLPLPRSVVQETNQLRFPIDVALHGDGNVPPQMSIQVEQLLNTRNRAEPAGWDNFVFRISMADNNDLSKSHGFKILVRPGQGKDIITPDTLIVHRGDNQASLTTRIASTLQELLVTSPPKEQHDRLVVKYSPRYRLSFSLLNEDAAAGPAAEGWKIEHAISRHLSATLHQLQCLHNFTIESQVQFHAALAFSPHESGNGQGFTLGPDELKIFINAAEWTLASSVSEDPVIHFVLFIPSASRRPLRIVNANGSAAGSNAFIVPQWGGIVILDGLPSADSFFLTASNLSSIFSTFRDQLMTLLGVPEFPGQFVHQGDNLLTKWQLDALYRKRAIENAHDSSQTLDSIVALVDAIEKLPVGPDVQSDVQAALNALNKLRSSTSAAQALRDSSEALVLSSRAFFNPGMLAMLYFPPEHKWAVYLPLFLPFMMPIVRATAKEISAWRKGQRKQKVE